MNRRAFLSLLAGATLDPERALWVPGKRIYSIPSTLGVIPLCPFFVNANRHLDGETQVADVMNGLLRWRWYSDAPFGTRSRMRSH